jgi:ethanolamine utilization microcompartment shell protein EutS
MAWRTSHIERFMALLDECLLHQELRDGLNMEDIRAVFQLTLLQATEFLVTGDTRVSSPEVYKGFLDVFFHGIMVQPTSEVVP